MDWRLIAVWLGVLAFDALALTAAWYCLVAIARVIA